MASFSKLQRNHKKQINKKIINLIEKCLNRGGMRKEMSIKTSNNKDGALTLKHFQLEQNEASSSAHTSCDDDHSFSHMSLKFLQSDQIMDAEGKCVDDPDYDPQTLYVPHEFLLHQTPVMRQWWDLKSQYYDTVLFFKMGDVYELFHMDAVIGEKELGLRFIKIREGHLYCRFPEISFDKFSNILVRKGYKVGRVDQTETRDQMMERCERMKSSSQFDKVVRREVCSVQSREMMKSSFIDGDYNADNNYLLAISEKIEPSDQSKPTYGVCFVDVTIGTFYVGQFEDDRHRSRLMTLVSHYPPYHVLYEKGKLSKKTSNILDGCLSQSVKEGLRSGAEFWDGGKTLKLLSKEKYFVDDGELKWPEAFDEMAFKVDKFWLVPRKKFSLGLSAVGAVIWYLRRCLMDAELLSLRMFEIYTPVDVTPEPHNKRLVMDGLTLWNLDILVNRRTGTYEGTLLQKLDNCKTSFGKRLFKQWLKSPLCSIDLINDRLNAMEDIRLVADIVSEVSVMLAELPDLEGLLNKIHKLSIPRSENYPDNTYNKRQIEDYITCVEGFKSAISIIEKFDNVAGSFRSNILKNCVKLRNSRGSLTRFLDLPEQLKFVDEAKKKGIIKPLEGINKDYDDALNDIRLCKKELNESLEQLKQRLHNQTLTYVGTAKKRYQVEVPNWLSWRMPEDYEMTSKKEGFKRYQNQEIQMIFGRLVDAEERRDAAQKDAMRCIFEKFNKQ